MNVRNFVLGWAAALAMLSLAQAARIQEPCMSEATDEGPCATSCLPDNCCANACVPCWQIFADYLYLRPRNAGLEYAVPMGGPIQTGAVPLQEGRTASLNPQFESGFRVGFGTAFDQCSTISATYTYYDNEVADAIDVNRPFVIRSMVAHPSSFDADTDWNSAGARQEIEFQLVDLDYRHVFLCDERYSLNYLVGIRYANLTQAFRSQFESIVTENVNTDVNFDGAGFRLGIEGERYSPCHVLFLYGKASASFLGGEFRSSYFQGSTVDPVIAETTWKEARFVSILDCEVGIGWTGCCGHVKASAGYMMSGWLNVVKSAEFISSVQSNKYHGPDKVNGNGLEFDGFVAHLEVQW
jgi:hypothetical protein